MNRYVLASLLLGLGCSSSKPIEGVWRPPPGEHADRIPGPINIKGFGPFDSFPAALKAACPMILSKPNATVLHIADKNLAMRLSTEYYAWLYYTPAQQYELSMLSDVSSPGSHLSGRTTCYLPPTVDDPRYTPADLKYIFAIHNHPFAGEPSDDDIHLAVEMANAHEWFVKTQDTEVHFSVIAFFSRSMDGEKPSCDGFYQYAPATNDLWLWTNTGNTWGRKKVGTIVWTGNKFNIERVGH